MKLGLGLALVAAASTSCVVASGSLMIGPALSLAFPGGRVAEGSGKLDDAAAKRIAERGHAALAVAARDALDAAAAAPNDVRLQRRAAAMVRSVAGDQDARTRLADFAARAERLIDHLVDVAPCPGLADAAATWLALDETGRGAEAYVKAAHQCDSVEAAIAAVRPLRELKRCEEAIEVLRGAWPRARGARAELGIAVLDGVTTCSDAITLRRNLGFVPPDVVEDYFALLDRRRAEAEAARRRADAERREQEAESRAFAATSHCQSECSAAVSNCTSSCGGDASCMQRCSALGHACNSGC